MPSINSSPSLRLRIFAGPNGSGKTTIIEAVKAYRVKNVPLDFGIYVNADDIAELLRAGKFSFKPYKILTSRHELVSTALASGLINKEFSSKKFKSCFRFSKSQKIVLVGMKYDERLAQILADFLRKKLICEKKKLSFETVFSHPSKLDIMREALDARYKIYLYFVSTESPEINKYRVAVREDKGGHNVAADKIESRYYRSLDLLYPAAQLTYQCYFFDNSIDGEEFRLIAHFKVVKGKKKWDKINKKDIPHWFKKYYLEKVNL